MFNFRSKIVLAFSVIILSGTILMVIIINFSTRSGYETFVRQNDIDFCIGLSEPLSDYYNLYGSWTDVDMFLQFPQARMNHMKGFMNRGGRTDRSEVHKMFPSVLLTDISGFIVFDTGDEFFDTDEQIEKSYLKKGVALYSDNKIVGYLFAGSMIFSGLDEKEEKFLNRITAIIIFVSLFILIASLIFSYFFSLKLTKPVDALSKAASEIETGRYNSRVAVVGSDEFSRLSRSFNKMAESLENNDLWRKQIVADSAHELRTPVSLIQGNLEMILDGVYKADREHLQNIYDETLVLSQLIKELQQLSSAESGSMILNIEKISITNLVESVLEIFKAGEVKENIKLNNKIDLNLPLVNGDSQKLKQVLSNIIANAFMHTPEGGSIEIRGFEKGNNIQIEVKDTGSGIEEKDLEKIFERFYRTDSSRNRVSGGSGLGLAISREIIKLHKGSIFAESSLGKGTTIKILFPLIN